MPTAQVIEIIAAAKGREPATLTLDTPLAALHVDSLDVVDLMFRFEETFGIALPASVEDGLTTVGDLVRLVERVIAEQAAARSAEPVATPTAA